MKAGEGSAQAPGAVNNSLLLEACSVETELGEVEVPVPVDYEQPDRTVSQFQCVYLIDSIAPFFIIIK